jgi:hypothetical protein
MNIKPGKMREWMEEHKLPPRLLFLLMGIVSTIWFLIRVIPKPSRASYPCMRVAAPMMSGLIIYILSIGGVTLTFRKARTSLKNGRYLLTSLLFILMLGFMVISVTSSTHFLQAAETDYSGPEDGPNQPFGVPTGIKPGRVVWAWDPQATNENCLNTFESKDYFFKPQNTNSEVVKKMFMASLLELTGEKNIKASWDALFKNLNSKKYQKKEGYEKGEKIFIKINQGTSRWLLTDEDKENGYYFPETFEPTPLRQAACYGTCETGPYFVLEILRELVNECGIAQEDISVGDPMTDIYGHNFDIWFSEFPKIAYLDKFATHHNRTMTKPTEEDYLIYSNKLQKDPLYDVIIKADYLINVANLKPHIAAGISLTAKNHFGSQGRPTAGHLHNYLITPRGAAGSNGGYHKYRVRVDMMGSKYLGRNTVLYVVDGLFGGGSIETRVPVKYFMPPFNNDWCSSLFMSLDQVALESVCFDFLRTEWNGINVHNPMNNRAEKTPNIRGVDDYLHQAADSRNWPEGIKYDPDGSGTSIPSLGVHEHWNNPEMKQYSANLGTGNGIELVSIPDTLVKSVSSKRKGNR